MISSPETAWRQNSREGVWAFASAGALQSGLALNHLREHVRDPSHHSNAVATAFSNLKQARRRNAPMVTAAFLSADSAAPCSGLGNAAVAENHPGTPQSFIAGPRDGWGIRDPGRNL